MSCKSCPHCREIAAKKRTLPFAKPRPRKAELREKAKAHQMSTRKIRAAVVARAAGRCECGCYGGSGVEMDHWLGGGRRRSMQSVETCWMLSAACHRLRTANLPFPGYWNDRFRGHCEKYGYPFSPHVEHQPLPSKRGP